MIVGTAEIIFLSLEEVLTIHKDQIQRYGGSYGVRDEGLLLSAIETPRMGFGDSYLHNGIFEMGAAYMFHIIKNHPFVDGNKRTGTTCAFTFLEQNDVDAIVYPEYFEELAMRVATSQLSKEGLAKTFEDLFAN